MLVHVMAAKKKDEETGYTNTSFRLQGVGLNGSIPVRVCYFGKTVMEPVMETVIDKATGKPKLDKDGKEQLIEKIDEQGNTIMQAKKDENGKEVKRDNNFSDRVEVLSMYSGDLATGAVCDPVEVIAKTRTVAVDGEKYMYFVVCGNEEIPIEVPDFSTADKPDYRYRSNCRKLSAMAKRV